MAYTPGAQNCKGSTTLKNIAPSQEYVFFLIQDGQNYELDRIFSLSIYQNTVHVKIFNSGLALVS